MSAGRDSLWQYRPREMFPPNGWWEVERRLVGKESAWERVAMVFGESRANWLADAFARRDDEIAAMGSHDER